VDPFSWEARTFEPAILVTRSPQARPTLAVGRKRQSPEPTRCVKSVKSTHFPCRHRQHRRFHFGNHRSGGASLYPSGCAARVPAWNLSVSSSASRNGSCTSQTGSDKAGTRHQSPGRRVPSPWFTRSRSPDLKSPPLAEDFQRIITCRAHAFPSPKAAAMFRCLRPTKTTRCPGSTQGSYGEH